MIATLRDFAANATSGYNPDDMSKDDRSATENTTQTAHRFCRNASEIGQERPRLCEKAEQVSDRVKDVSPEA